MFSIRGRLVRCAVPIVLGSTGIGLLVAGRSDGITWGLIVLALALATAWWEGGGRVDGRPPRLDGERRGGRAASRRGGGGGVW